MCAQSLYEKDWHLGLSVLISTDLVLTFVARIVARKDGLCNDQTPHQKFTILATCMGEVTPNLLSLFSCCQDVVREAWECP